MPTIQDQKAKLLQLIQKAIEQDNSLREKYQIGDKFRFIRDRLSALKSRVEEGLAEVAKDSGPKTVAVGEDETLVYVYLYNAQGTTFSTWNKMVHPSVLYEYSVNRPIYLDKGQIDAAIRAKSERQQHGYLTMVVKKTDILPDVGEGAKDPYGAPLVKVREGALQFKCLISFTHNLHEYILKESGEIVRKPS